MPTASFLVGEPRVLRQSMMRKTSSTWRTCPPELTGLPMVVWVSQRGRAQHAAQVKVSLINGRRMIPEQTISVSASPEVEIVAGGQLPQHKPDAVRGRIEQIGRPSSTTGTAISSPMSCSEGPVRVGFLNICIELRHGRVQFRRVVSLHDLGESHGPAIGVAVDSVRRGCRWPWPTTVSSTTGLMTCADADEQCTSRASDAVPNCECCQSIVLGDTAHTITCVTR